MMSTCKYVRKYQVMFNRSSSGSSAGRHIVVGVSVTVFHGHSWLWFVGVSAWCRNR